MALKAMSIEGLKELISGMRPEDRDQLLCDIIQQLKVAKAHPDLEKDLVAQAQMDETIVGLVDALHNKTLWDM